MWRSPRQSWEQFLYYLDHQERTMQHDSGGNCHCWECRLMLSCHRSWFCRLRCPFVPGPVKCSGMKNNINVGDSGMSESSELTGTVLEYLTMLVTTGFLWGRNMPAVNGLLGSTGGILVGDIPFTDSHSEAGHAALPEFCSEYRYVTGHNFQ